MTREEIIALARKAGATPYTNRHYPDRPTHTFFPEALEAFAALVLEAAAVECDELSLSQNIDWQVGTLDCAAAIRAMKPGKD